VVARLREVARTSDDGAIAPGGLSQDRFVSADIATAEGCKAICDAVLERLGGVDMIVHVAGGSSHRQAVCRSDDVEWSNALSLNLLAAVRIDRTLLPLMLDTALGRHRSHHVDSAANAASRGNHRLCGGQGQRYRTTARRSPRRSARKASARARFARMGRDEGAVGLVAEIARKNGVDMASAKKIVMNSLGASRSAALARRAKSPTSSDSWSLPRQARSPARSSSSTENDPDRVSGRLQHLLRTRALASRRSRNAHVSRSRRQSMDARELCPGCDSDLGGWP